MPTKELTAAKQARELAEAQLAEARAKVETTALLNTRRLIESPQPVVVPWQEYPAFDSFNGQVAGWERPYYQTSPDDRTEGRYRPLYESEQDLQRMRANARRFYHFYPIAQGAVETLTNYVLGNGWEFVVKPKEKYKDIPGVKELRPIVQTVLDRFLERNNFVGVLDREIHKQSRIDGEAFPTVYPDGRDARIELIDPDFICEPDDPKPIERMLGITGLRSDWSGWWHGVHTLWAPILKRDDVERPQGYHASFGKTRGKWEWDYLFASRVQHVKRNVGPGARRGVSDYEINKKDLEHEAKIRRNTAEGAAILAAIVMVRQHAEGTPRSTIEQFAGSNADFSASVPRAGGGAQTRYGQTMQPGTVQDIPHGMEATLGPLGTLRSPVYLEVAQYLNRVIGTARSVPEFLISGDASNANYSSTLVAEGPFVKAREHDQAFDAGHLESLIWKGFIFYYKAGWFPCSWDQLVEWFDIKAEFTSPASRDKTEGATVNKTLYDAGILSKRTWAADSGLDLDEELANRAMEPAQPAPVVMSPFGAPLMGGPPSPNVQQVRNEALARGVATARTLAEARAVARAVFPGMAIEHCGANAEGGGGFQPGNDCSGEGGGGGASEGGGSDDSEGIKVRFKETKEVDARYSVAGATVSGLTVLDDIPNQDSIEAELGSTHTVLSGVRELPMSDFTIGQGYANAREQERVEKLAAKIKASGTIAPLIVVADAKGPYILEGGHRFDALAKIGVKSFPALVVTDNADDEHGLFSDGY